MATFTVCLSINLYVHYVRLRPTLLLCIHFTLDGGLDIVLMLESATMNCVGGSAKPFGQPRDQGSQHHDMVHLRSSWG